MNSMSFIQFEGDFCNTIDILFRGQLYLFKLALWLGFLIFIVIKVWAKTRSIESNLKKIDVMSGEDFEYYVANTIQKYGFREVYLTGGSGDFGVDIIASFKKVKYAIQVKRYKALVGIAAVQEAYAGAKYYAADAAIVITNSHFTDAAKELANSCEVILINRKSFINKSFIHDLK